MQSRPEFLNTAEVLVNNGGDIMSAAIELNTHHSTVRYRWNKIKLMLNKEDMSDYEFYKEISLALAIKK
ncbi:MAG: helix-turn-helix domain-containing protein [Anaerovoracaceae bacterium]